MATRAAICRCSIDHTTFSGALLGEVVGLDPNFDQAWFMGCKECESLWLRVLFEMPHYSKSGHWYDVHLPPDFAWQNFAGTRENIDQAYVRYTPIFRGGSYFNNRVEPFQGLPKRLV